MKKKILFALLMIFTLLCSADAKTISCKYKVTYDVDGCTNPTVTINYNGDNEQVGFSTSCPNLTSVYVRNGDKIGTGNNLSCPQTVKCNLNNPSKMTFNFNNTNPSDRNKCTLLSSSEAGNDISYKSFECIYNLYYLNDVIGKFKVVGSDLDDKSVSGNIKKSVQIGSGSYVDVDTMPYYESFMIRTMFKDRDFLIKYGLGSKNTCPKLTASFFDTTIDIDFNPFHPDDKNSFHAMDLVGSKQDEKDKDPSDDESKICEYKVVWEDGIENTSHLQFVINTYGNGLKNYELRSKNASATGNDIKKDEDIIFYTGLSGITKPVKIFGGTVTKILNSMEASNFDESKCYDGDAIKHCESYDFFYIYTDAEKPDDCISNEGTLNDYDFNPEESINPGKAFDDSKFRKLLFGDDMTCKEIMGESGVKIIKTAIKIIQVGGVIATIVFGMTSFIPAIVNKDSDGLKKSLKKFVILLIILAALLILPPLVRSLGGWLEFDVSCLE